MAENEFSKALDFGIENTVEISGDDLFERMDVDPNKVKKIDPEAEAKKKEEEEKKKKEAASTPTGENDDLLDMLDEKEDKEDPDDKKAKEKEDNGEGDDKENEDEDNYFTSISKELFKLGVFTKDAEEEEPEITTGEEFLELFINEKKKGAIEMLEGILGRHGEDKRELFDAIILKGASPKEYLEKFTVLEDLRAVDLTDTDLQEKVMREELRAQGWDKADVDAEVAKIISYGDLESAAKRYHKSLIKRTENQLASEKQKKEDESRLEIERDTEYKQNITAVINTKLREKEFDGIPLSPELAKTVLDSIYTKKWRLPSGETITDFDNEILRLKRPENHAQKVKIGLLFQLLKTDPTLSTIKKKAISKESDSLFNELEKKKLKKQSATITKQPESTNSWFK